MVCLHIRQLLMIIPNIWQWSFLNSYWTSEAQEFMASMNLSQHDTDGLKNTKTTNKVKLRAYPVRECCEGIWRADGLPRDNLAILNPIKLMEPGLKQSTKNVNCSPQNLRWMPLEIEGHHRKLKFRSGSERLRSVLLLHLKDKQLILATARSNLKNTSVYISEDISE